MPKYFGFEAVGALLLDKDNMSLFSDPDAWHEDVSKKEKNMGTMTDDEDDTTLTSNQKKAVDMDKPEYLAAKDAEKRA
jgi:hypothetical protein